MIRITYAKHLAMQLEKLIINNVTKVGIMGSGPTLKSRPSGQHGITVNQDQAWNSSLCQVCIWPLLLATHLYIIMGMGEGPNFLPGGGR